MFFERPKKSKQEKSRYRDGRACPAHEPKLSFNSPSHFLILHCPPVFNAPVRTAQPCAEPNLAETTRARRALPAHKPELT
jgi:hypothetical protein